MKIEQYNKGGDILHKIDNLEREIKKMDSIIKDIKENKKEYNGQIVISTKKDPLGNNIHINNYILIILDFLYQTYKADIEKLKKEFADL